MTDSLYAPSSREKDPGEGYLDYSTPYADRPLPGLFCEAGEGTVAAKEGLT